MLPLRFNPNNLSINQLRLIIVFAGLILCLISLIPDRVISRDGGLYIQTAEIFVDQGFGAAFKSFNWPFYPILIGLFQLIAPFSYETSAHVINIVLYLLLIDSFTRFYWQWNPSTHYKWMPMIVILAYTGINDYRPEIFRDWGFWAFSWLSFYCFIKAYKEERMSYFLGWQAAIILAFLFRVEAIAFMALLPMVFIFFKKMPILFLKSICLFIILIITVLVIASVNLGNWSSWDRIDFIFAYLNLPKFVNEFIVSSLNIAKFVIPYHYKNHALSFVFSGLFGVLFVKSLLKLGYFYLAILMYALFKKLPKPESCALPLSLLFISFSVVFLYFCNTKVIAGRYVIQINLVLLLFICYYSDIIIFRLKNNESVLILVLITGFFITNLLFGIIHTSSTKLHMKEMGEWVKNNIDTKAWIIFNTTQLKYYSDRKDNLRVIADLNYSDYKNYDYLLLYIKTDPNAPPPKQTKKIRWVSNQRGTSSTVLYKVIK